ncbi:DNA repair protein rad13 [Psilocybe cubensis]|uniref:DNA repair protein rad13 n=1 Tax=Psilocybe cubensis TaxID=181762 RepID=A0ACB8H1K4_PSICU|nr:DNA repair protein rad13 [Psilocybe cubensis]KAH9481605.1 DNA repair protein rad13 [Psilocybe cubensis]
MRDKEGRALVNAHVLGFLRRIAKLLFFGIKPVFVFDGGAPALKRSTLNERKKKKSGAATTHVKLAEKLLAAQMRREALNQAQSNQSKGKNRDILLDENTVFLEDIDGTAPKTPVRRKPPTPSSSSTKKNKFHDHDPYKLPEVDLEEAITKATRSAAPDPRLATEDELRTFIEEMRPEDFDINSPEFRELPTEIQYEIIGDLRLKSRQTSYARLQKMLKTARTPLDFSKQQIRNLQQRNALTQQLLMTTDTIGKANIVIPIRIASERNREYVLMKNEGVDGGWILGIKDIGTREKPIVLDHEEAEPEEEEDSDADMEEVEMPPPTHDDTKLREYQRENALSGITRRIRDNRSKFQPISRNKRSAALKSVYGDDALSPSLLEESDEDDMLAYAIQESLDQSKSKCKSTTISIHETNSTAETSTRQQNISLEGEDDEDDFYVDSTPRTRLETALSFANSGSSRVLTTPPKNDNKRPMFGRPELLTSSNNRISKDGLSPSIDDDNNYIMEDMSPLKANKDTHDYKAHTESPTNSAVGQSPQASIEMVRTENIENSGFGQPFLLSGNTSVSRPRNPPSTIIDSVPLPNEDALTTTATFGTPSLLLASSDTASPKAKPVSYDKETATDLKDFPMEEGMAAHLLSTTPPSSLPIREFDAETAILASDSDEDMEEIPVDNVAPVIPFTPMNTNSTPPSQPHYTPSSPNEEQSQMSKKDTERLVDSSETEEERLFAWSRTPSPIRENNSPRRPPSSPVHWDAAEEIDINAEQGEFARFMSQVKGKNMDDVRKEIDAEITALDQQRKNAMRDSEDITQQMVTQIMTMLRLFGIPYITAPMEAEAQCAELVSLGLVDGVITDDSDVFLFGAQRVYKNMFNQSKTVECFLLTDLSRELGLDRDTLIRLAYLLGSDYTEGLPGVGPVVAMELLKEFPGISGLHKFKDWWAKVQSGKDREEDNQSKFRKQFKKKFKNLYLPADWPNSVVRDAYYHPTVDSSEEPFKWGMPDLDGLRTFFHQELGWSQAKVDELILPILQKMNKRNQACFLIRNICQGNLNEFLDIAAGSGTHAPRQSRAYQSKRLQQVISDFRKRQKSGSAQPSSRSNTPLPEEKSDASGSGDNTSPPSKKRRTTVSSKGKGKSKSTSARQTKAVSSSRRQTGGSRRGGARGSKRKDADSSGSSSPGYVDEAEDAPAPVDDNDAALREVALNLRPRIRPRPNPEVGHVVEPRLGSTNVNDDLSMSSSAAG